jgi:hypothetical protein
VNRLLAVGLADLVTTEINLANGQVESSGEATMQSEETRRMCCPICGHECMTACAGVICCGPHPEAGLPAVPMREVKTQNLKNMKDD